MNKQNPNTTNTNLTILQWNIRSLNTNKEFLELITEATQPDIIALQETFIKNKNHIKLRTYYVAAFTPATNEHSNGGTAILCKNNIIANELENINNDLVNSQTIEVHTASSNEKIYITNIYRYHNKTEAAKNQFTEHIRNIHNKYKHNTSYIIGDFNAHHPLWEESHTIDRSTDKKLADMLTEEDITIHNNGTYTRIGQRRGENNTSVDITLSNATNLTTNTTWETLEMHGNSDHLPIKITINNIENSYEPIKNDKYKYHKMNKRELEKELRNVEWAKLDSDNPTILKAQIEDKIKECMNKHIPRNRQGQTILPKKAKFTVPWWNK